MKKLASLSLSGLHLKLIGWLFTLCTVAAIVFFPLKSVAIPKIILSYAGYISLPIFAFLLVEGFVFTRSMERYFFLLLAAAVITEPFYDYFCTGSWLNLVDSNGQNILFAMVLGLVQLYFLRYLGTANFVRTFFCVVMVICSAVWTFVLNIPNGFYFQLLVGIFYLLHDRELLMLILGAVLGLLSLGTPVLAFPLLYIYDGERGSYSKYLFYIAYPLVWILAAVVKLLMA